LDSLVQPQWSPLFRTDTQQSAVGSGWYPPVEGFLFLTSGHRGAMARPRATTSAANFLPAELSLPALREAAAGCKGCDLWRLGTQTVFGEGPESAGVMFVGEQPGDQEDRAGKPFVGPAGRLLDKALTEAGIDRSATYMTNTVKHFKWKARGKRRIHQKPTWAETTACRPWLEAELAVVHPRVLVLLGATAAQSLLGREFRVTQNRRTLVESNLADAVTATIHPSAILRGEPEQRQTEFAAFVDDLRFVASLL
jgi:uracil-DNA glycosylase family protein